MGSTDKHLPPLANDRRRSQRGSVLGGGMVLLVILLMAGGLAAWGLRSETTSAGSDRLERQLIGCAEAGRGWAKQYLTTTEWEPIVDDNNVCSYFRCNERI